MKTLLFFMALCVLFLLNIPAFSLETTRKTNLGFSRQQASLGGVIKPHFKHKSKRFLNTKKINVVRKKNEIYGLIFLPTSVHKDLNTLSYTSKTSSSNIKNKKFAKASKKTFESTEGEHVIKQKKSRKLKFLYIQDLKMIKPFNPKLKHDFKRKDFVEKIVKKPKTGIDLSRNKVDKIKVLPQIPLNVLETKTQARTEFPREQRSPGGIAKLYFKHKPELFAKDKKVNVFSMKEKNDWLVLIPLSLYKGTKSLEFTSKSSNIYKTHLIKLEKDNYQKQYIKVKNKEFVIASKKTLKRIEIESKRKKKAFSRFTKMYNSDLLMLKPLDSKLRHDFGRRRFFNGVPKNPHGGIDLSGKKGDKIKAPLAGTIIIVGKLFYNGNMIIIDHGQGLMTAYSHLSKFLKKDGDWVKRGEYIGEVGSTGRATGPHLHWSVYLGGEPVNPDLFLEDATL